MTGLLRKTGTVIFLYLLFLPLVTLLTVYLFFAFYSQLSTLNANITGKELKRVEAFAKNIGDTVLAHTKRAIYGELASDLQLRENLEESMRLFITEQYAYLYLLYRDDAGRFRYLIDASVKEGELGEFDQKFDHEGEVWDEVYDTKRPVHKEQRQIDDLWITYIYPLVRNGTVEAVLVFDFSNSDFAELTHATVPMKNFFLYLSMFLTVMLVIGYVQFYLYYRSHRRGIVDPLTGAYNRQYLKERSRGLRLADYQVCMVDIDHFKRINDNYGHDAGDAVLKNFTKRLRANIRKDDFIVRYGGEEFIVFLHNCLCESDHTIVERLRQTVRGEPVVFGEHTIRVTASFGLNPSPSKNRSLEEAISEADACLYEAKRSGRDRIVSSADLKA